jgi:WD40 repeat protein
MGGKSGIGSLAFAADGSMLAATCRDMVLLWDVDSGELRRTLTDSDGKGLAGTAFHPDGSLLASFGPTVKLWDVATGELRRTLPPLSKPPRSAAFSPDGSILAVADGKTVVLWGKRGRR